MKVLWLASLLFGALALTACAPVVHSGCDSDGDCPERCQTGRAFPQGLCTRTCGSNADCPADSWCVEVENTKLCLQACSSMDQCRDFGSGYICKDKRDADGEQQLVCLGD